MCCKKKRKEKKLALAFACGNVTVEADVVGWGEQSRAQKTGERIVTKGKRCLVVDEGRKETLMALIVLSEGEEWVSHERFWRRCRI